MREQSKGSVLKALSFRLIETLAGFEQVANEWDALFRTLAHGNPALTSAHIHAFWSNLSEIKDQPLVVLAYENGTLVGGIPLVMVRVGRKLILRTFSSAHTYGVDLLSSPERRLELLRRIVSHLFSVYRRVFYIQLCDVPSNSDTLRLSSASLRYLVHRVECRKGSYLSLRMADEDVLNRLSENFRRNIQKQSRRAKTLGNIRAEFVSQADDLDERFLAFLEIESSGWKGVNRTAIACNERERAFYRELTKRLDRSAILEWHFLWAGTALISAHLAARSGGRVTLVKIAYNEAFGRIGPGNLLFLELLRREIRLGSSSEIDCITDMNWHRNWRMEQRSYLSVTIYPRRLLPILLSYIPQKIGSQARQSSLVRGLWRRLRNYLPKQL